MAVNSQAIITRAYKDIGGLRPGMGMSTDVLNESLSQLNILVDGWALNRDFIFQFTGGNWVVLVTFPDLSTSFTLAKGNELALHKNLAVRLYPALKIYVLHKLAEPQIQQLEAEAAAALQAISGVGPS